MRLVASALPATVSISIKSPALHKFFQHTTYHGSRIYNVYCFWHTATRHRTCRFVAAASIASTTPYVKYTADGYIVLIEL